MPLLNSHTQAVSHTHTYTRAPPHPSLMPCTRHDSWHMNQFQFFEIALVRTMARMQTGNMQCAARKKSKIRHTNTNHAHTQLCRKNFQTKFIRLDHVCLTAQSIALIGNINRNSCPFYADSIHSVLSLPPPCAPLPFPARRFTSTRSPYSQCSSDFCYSSNSSGNNTTWWKSAAWAIELNLSEIIYLDRGISGSVLGASIAAVCSGCRLAVDF